MSTGWGPLHTNLKGTYDADGFVATHEYVICGTVSSLKDVGEIPVSEDKLQDDWSKDEYGLFKQGDGLRRTGADAPRSRREKGWFPIFVTDTRVIYVTENDLSNNPEDTSVYPIDSNGEEMSWSWSKNKIASESYNLLLKGSKDTGYSFYKKQRSGLSGYPSRKSKSFFYKPEYSSTHGGNSAKDVFGYRMNSFTPKSVSLISDLIVLSNSESKLNLDYYAGSGTTGHAVINLNRHNRQDQGNRKYILIEQGEYFDTVLKPRIQKVVYSEAWKEGKATAPQTGISHAFKVVKLESYEDALNNLEPKRTRQQKLALDSPDAQGADGFREQYLLHYLLDVETRGSQSLLNIQAFTDPTAYRLKVKRPGSDESGEVNIDLLETFNWLIGLTVQHITAPQSFSAAFERDSEKRLRLNGRLRQEEGAPYWFRTVTGRTPDGRKALIIWRKLTGEPEQDNLVLDEWFRKHAYSTRDTDFDLIYVNGGNNLPNVRRDDETWKVRLIEEDFHRLMFENREGV